MEIVADSFMKIFQSIASSWVSEQQLLCETCGISVNDSVIPLRQRVSVGICSVSQWLESVGHLTSPSKVVKVSLMNESLKVVDVHEGRATQAVASSSFNVSFKAAKRLLSGVAGGKTVTEMTAQAKRKNVFDTEWPEKVKVFCLTKPICQEAPGESVSIGYGQRAEKYIRQFSVSEIFSFFVPTSHIN